MEIYKLNEMPFNGIVIFAVALCFLGGLLIKTFYDSSRAKRKARLNKAVSEAEDNLVSVTEKAIWGVIRAVTACADAYITATGKKSTTPSLEVKHSLRGCTSNTTVVGDDYVMAVERQIVLSLPGNLKLTRTVCANVPLKVALTLKVGDFDNIEVERTAATQALFADLLEMEKAVSACACEHISDIIGDSTVGGDNYLRYSEAVVYLATVAHTTDTYRRSGDHTVVSDLYRLGKKE